MTMSLILFNMLSETWDSCEELDDVHMELGDLSSSAAHERPSEMK